MRNALAKYLTAVSASILIVTVAGCGSIPPAPTFSENIFEGTGISVNPSSIPIDGRLSRTENLLLIPSENTRQTVRFISEYQKNIAGSASPLNFNKDQAIAANDPRNTVNSVVLLLKKKYANVVYGTTYQEALKDSRNSTVAVADLRFEMPRLDSYNYQASWSMTIYFIGGDGKALSKVSASSSQVCPGAMAFWPCNETTRTQLLDNLSRKIDQILGPSGQSD